MSFMHTLPCPLYFYQLMLFITILSIPISPLWAQCYLVNTFSSHSGVNGRRKHLFSISFLFWRSVISLIRGTGHLYLFQLAIHYSFTHTVCLATVPPVGTLNRMEGSESVVSQCMMLERCFDAFVWVWHMWVHVKAIGYSTFHFACM